MNTDYIENNDTMFNASVTLNKAVNYILENDIHIPNENIKMYKDKIKILNSEMRERHDEKVLESMSKLTNTIINDCKT